MRVNPAWPFIAPQLVHLRLQPWSSFAGTVVHRHGGEGARQGATVERIPLRDQRDLGIAVSFGARLQVDLAPPEFLQKLLSQQGVGFYLKVIFYCLRY